MLWLNYGIGLVGVIEFSLILFPCNKISDMLKRSREYQKKCKEVCSAEEYTMLEKAFFDKENNLNK